MKKLAGPPRLVFTSRPILFTFFAVDNFQADVMSGRNIAENQFVHMAPAGIAMLLAPIMSARFSVRGSYGLSIFFGLLCSMVLMQVQKVISLWCMAVL